MKVTLQEHLQQHTEKQGKDDEKFIGKVVDAPVALQRQVPMIHKVQKTVEVPQVQVNQSTSAVEKLENWWRRSSGMP